MASIEQPRKPFRKFLRWLGFVAALTVVLLIYFRYFWVFGEGAKSGQLNYLVYKGVLFKTYEGRLIQAGVSGQSGSMQSNEFIFSVEDEKVARTLMSNSGHTFNLHYLEYQGALPWRGMSVFVVDSIISMSDGGNGIVPATQ